MTDKTEQACAIGRALGETLAIALDISPTEGHLRAYRAARYFAHALKTIDGDQAAVVTNWAMRELENSYRESCVDCYDEGAPTRMEDNYSSVLPGHPHDDTPETMFLLCPRCGREEVDGDRIN